MNNSFKKVIMLILIFIFLIGLVFGTYKVFIWKKDNNSIIRIKEIIDESVDNNDEEANIKIDFNKLKSINSDTVGYLKVNNTNIDYVVVKGKDNKFYLNHNFEKGKNSAGWVFADYHNKFDGTDKNIVIYAHNMKSGIMFGSLKKVLNSNWYLDENNRLIKLITEDGEFVYYVFSVYKIKRENYYINTEFNNMDFYKFVNTLRSRSIYDFGVKLNKDDKILTLSTCSSGSSYRTVLHAKMIY